MVHAFCDFNHQVSQPYVHVGGDDMHQTKTCKASPPLQVELNIHIWIVYVVNINKNYKVIMIGELIIEA